MTSNAQHVLAMVRRQILNGTLEPGAKISEVGIAADMSVSRTPVRTALATLQAEGLIEKRDGRGFTVKSISVAEVAKAISVRAALEALAARTMAENGMSEETEASLLDAIATTEAILENSLDMAALVDTYHEANVRFHEVIMRDCGNELIAHTFERIAMLPLAALGSLAFDRTNPQRERMRLTVGHSQHVIIFDALKKRDAARAEAMMREHSHATLNYADLFVRRVYDFGDGA